MLKERFEQIRNELGLNNADLCQLADISLQSITTWTDREAKRVYVNGIPGEGLIKFAAVWGMNIAWFLSNGHDYERWSPEIASARRALRKWARTATYDSARERLVAVWEQLHEHAPSLREEIWAAYLYWVECERVGRRPSVPVTVHMSDWLSCKQGTLNPGEMQLQGAAFVTGLPLKWLQTGDAQYLEGMNDDDLARLGRYLKEMNLDPEDAYRMLQIEFLSPR